MPATPDPQAELIAWGIRGLSESLARYGIPKYGTNTPRRCFVPPGNSPTVKTTSDGPNGLDARSHVTRSSLRLLNIMASLQGLMGRD